VTSLRRPTDPAQHLRCAPEREDKVIAGLARFKAQAAQARAQTALMGCFVDEIRPCNSSTLVDAFLKPSDVAAVVELANRSEKQAAGTSLQQAESPIAVGVRSATAAHLCTYCIVRLRRGAEVSGRG